MDARARLRIRSRYGADLLRGPRPHAPGRCRWDCDDCASIPPKRRKALPGVRTCVACQAERDKAVVHSAINRRGSKDSQLR